MKKGFSIENLSELKLIYKITKTLTYTAGRAAAFHFTSLRDRRSVRWDEESPNSAEQGAA